MKSPFTGGRAVLRREVRVYVVEGVRHECARLCYVCEDTGSEFTTPEVDEWNMAQMRKLFRK